MRRILIGATVALLSFMIGVSVAMLKLGGERKCQEGGASQLAAAQGGAATPVDFAEVFRGFDFAGSRVVSDESGTCPFSEADAWPLPEDMGGWRTYVFHRRDGRDDEQAFELLQARFKAQGIETSVPHGHFHGGRMHPDILLFQGRGYAGNVRPQAHRSASGGEGGLSSGKVSDYVLTFTWQP